MNSLLSAYLIADLVNLIQDYVKERRCPECELRIPHYEPASILVDGWFECIYCCDCLVNGCNKLHRKNSRFCYKHRHLEKEFPIVKKYHS